MTLIAPGTCRHCGCTEHDACRLAHGDTCSWIDHARLVCSNPACIRAELERKAAARAARQSKYSGWGFGAILEDLRKQRRARSRRKGKAA